MKQKILGWKKAISLLLCTAMLFSLCAQTALAAGGTEDSGPFEERGTEDDPYQISNLADLEALRDAVNRGNSYKNSCFLLTADIDMSKKYSEKSGESWTPIGSYEYNEYTSADNVRPFDGIFDGGEHTINGLTINFSSSGNNNSQFSYGLFGSNTGTIKNLTVSGQITVDTDALVAIGGVVGTNENGIIQDCKSAVSISANGFFSYVGGIVGVNGTSCTVERCENSGTISGTGSVQSLVGGIVGINNVSCKVEGCNNYGAVSAAGQSTSCAGGIVGGNGDGCIVLDCLNDGEVSATKEDSAAEQGTSDSYAGGIVGMNGSMNGGDDVVRSIVQNCHNQKNVSASGADFNYAGGIAGINQNGTMTSCYNNGTASAEGGNGTCAGGVAGMNLRGTLESCGNTGMISVQESVGGYAGGIVGDNTGDLKRCNNSGTVFAEGSIGGAAGGIAGSSQEGTIENSCNSGAVSAASESTNYVGGIAGMNIAGSTVNSCYSIGSIPMEESDTNCIGGVIGGIGSGSVKNCYYLSGTASGGIGYEEPDGEVTHTITAKSAEEFASGEVAYLLNGSKTDGTQVWYQTLGSAGDASPVLDSTHRTVYELRYTLVYPGQEEPEEKALYANSTADVPINLPSADENAGEEQLWLWYTSPEHTGDTVTMAIAAQGGANTYYAVPGYSVTLDPDGGEINSGSITGYPAGIGATLPTDVTKAGYKFAGWYETDTEGGPAGTSVTEIGQDATGAKTFVAKWLSKNAEVKSVSVGTMGGTVKGTNITMTLPYDAALPTEADDIKITLAHEAATISVGPVTEDNGATWQFTVRAESGDTETYTLSITQEAAPNADNQARLDEIEELLTSAPNAPETWKLTDVPEDVSEETLEQRLEEALLAYLEENGQAREDVNWTIKITEYTAPQDGTADDLDGMAGSFTATVVFSMGDKADDTYAETDRLTLHGTLAPASYTEPTGPDKPTGPDGPTDPDKPVDPDKPIGPDKPTDPDKPDTPDGPTIPDEPATPEQTAAGDTEALIGAVVVIGGGAAALAYHYREALPIWKLAGVVVLADETAGAAGTALPAANAAVALYQNGQLVKTLTTDAGGCFAARLPKGTYEAVVTWEKDGVTYTTRRELTAESLLDGEAVQQIVLDDAE